MNIPAYTPYLQQERHRAVESVLTLSAETLQIPEVSRRLGHYAAALSKIVDQATIPNMRGNEIIMDGRSAKSTPVVAVRMGEHVLRQSKDLVFNPSQKYMINKIYKSGVASRIFKGQSQFYENGPSLLEVAPINSPITLARVHANTLKNGSAAWPVHLYSRPLVQFNLDAHSELSPVVALHEFTHVMQFNQKPIDRADRSLLPDELEAFYVTAQIIRGYQDAGMHEELLAHTSENNQNVALEIEAIRSRHNGPITGHTPFLTRPKLVDDLVANRLPITPEIGHLIDSLSDETTA